jgi:hypothetical protein
MYLSQSTQEDLNQGPGQLEDIFASSDPSEEFDPAAIDEVLKEDEFFDPFEESYDNRLDFFALRLLGKISSPGVSYDDTPESDYCDDYLDDDSREQVPYPLRALDENNEDSDGLPNLRLVDKDSNEEERAILGEKDNPFEPKESEEGSDEEDFKLAA